MNFESRIAVLMTCYNRRETTLRCLENLFSQKLPEHILLNVFLVDDGCTDGTGDAVRSAYPQVQVIQGTGDLFWCNGMRLAWEHAAKEDPDFYLWLNDDVQLRDDAVSRLIETWKRVQADEVVENVQIDEECDPGSTSLTSPKGRFNDFNVSPTIIVGSTCDPETGERTYGGQRRPGKHPAKLVAVLPQDIPVDCDTFQGNVVLVPKAVYQRVGNMHPFSHAMGDTDYGLRAKRAGCRNVVMPGFAGACEKNKQGDPQKDGFRKAWAVLMRRLPPGDYYRFLVEHVGWRWVAYWLRPYIRTMAQGVRQKTQQLVRPSGSVSKGS